MRYGYARVSTKTQDLERQKKNIYKEYPDAIIYSDTFTGSTNDRPEWNRLMKKVRKGDTIIFDSVSRFSRDEPEAAFELYEELFNKGIEMVFLKEPLVNTEVFKELLEEKPIELTGSDEDILLDAFNKYSARIRKKNFIRNFEQSHQELLNIRQATKDGMKVAKDNGKQIGRKAGERLTTHRELIAREVIKKGLKMGYPDDIIMFKIGQEYKRKLPGQKASISRNSYYKYKRNLLGKGVRPYNKKSQSPN